MVGVEREKKGCDLESKVERERCSGGHLSLCLVSPLLKDLTCPPPRNPSRLGQKVGNRAVSDALFFQEQSSEGGGRRREGEGGERTTGSEGRLGWDEGKGIGLRRHLDAEK